MKCCAFLALAAITLHLHAAPASANLLVNGNLDLTYAQEIVPGFFLPKPQVWENIGTRTISGPYEDEMSSEPWAGPAPTPVTTDGVGQPPHPVGTGGPDGAIFYKPFTGNAVNGPATGHLRQTVPGTPGEKYFFRGWAGAEANFLGGIEFAIEFLDAGNVLMSAAVLDLVAAGLHTDNGEPFDYKQFTVGATAPAGTAFVRVRGSMINGLSNPVGGGQALVMDDFELFAGALPSDVPEPATATLALLALTAIATRRRRVA